MILTVIGIVALVWLVVGVFYCIDRKREGKLKEKHFLIWIKFPVVAFFLIALFLAVEGIKLIFI